MASEHSVNLATEQFEYVPGLLLTAYGDWIVVEDRLPEFQPYEYRDVKTGERLESSGGLIVVLRDGALTEASLVRTESRESHWEENFPTNSLPGQSLDVIRWLEPKTLKPSPTAEVLLKGVRPHFFKVIERLPDTRSIGSSGTIRRSDSCLVRTSEDSFTVAFLVHMADANPHNWWLDISSRDEIENVEEWALVDLSISAVAGRVIFECSSAME